LQTLIKSHKGQNQKEKTSQKCVHSQQNEMAIIFKHKTFFRKILQHFDVIIIAAMKVVKMQIVENVKICSDHKK